MKKTSMIVALFAALFCATSVPSQAAEAVAPSYLGGIAFKDPSFIGTSKFVIGASTPSQTAVLGDSGSGLLYGICPSSGVAGDYSVAFDSGSVASMNLSLQAKLISPAVRTSTMSASETIEFTDNCWYPRWPVHYTNGLIGMQSAGGTGKHYTVYYYRQDSGVNPE